MASSNRHWPSMFKSKPCNNHHHHHHQWQHDHANPNSLISTACHRPPYTSVPGSEERSPEPKPRWNPKPEQIRILEAIFNSGMVNPPRDEIRKIRAQLQEYGQVGDANVFYWFQNRKSRSKHKLRHLQNSKQPPTTTTAAASGPAPSTSSSSSDKSSPKSVEKALSISNSNILDISSSPTASVNQTYFQAPAEFLPESFLFSGRFSFPEMSSVVHAPADQAVGNLLLGEIMMNHGHSKKAEDHEKMSYTTTTVATAPTTATTSIVPSTTVNVPSAISHFLGVGIGESQPQVGPAKSTVFINDVSFEVSVGPFNVREAFGDDAVLIHSNGHPVFTNEWGVTLQSLQHGGFYYLVRTLAPVTVSEAQLIWYINSFIPPFSIQFLFGLRW